MADKFTWPIRLPNYKPISVDKLRNGDVVMDGRLYEEEDKISLALIKIEDGVPTFHPYRGNTDFTEERDKLLFYCSVYEENQ